MADHRHKWILDSPRGEWSLGRCKHCRNVEAFSNVLPYEPKMSKREFFRSLGVPKPYTPEEKAPVIEWVKKFGMSSASRQFNIPTPTIHLWTKGQSPLKKISAKYDQGFKDRALKMVDETGNISLTARTFNLPRATLQSWRIRD
tara:strand:- start:3319 stop:3750 length:432 start_codon:yes stop_codon:yes gene_type:complete